MTLKADILAKMRQEFERRYAPEDEADYNHTFKFDLDRLIYAAYAAAQEPFVKELEMWRENALKTGSADDQRMCLHQTS